MTRLRSLPLRVRLVAGFAAAMLLLLTAAGTFVYWRVEYALDRGLDTELAQSTRTISPLVRPDGSVSAPASADATGVGWQVLDPAGEVLDAGGPAPATPLVGRRTLARVGHGFATVDVGTFFPIADQPYRVRISALRHSPGAGGTAAYVLVGVRRDHRDEALRELLLQLAVAGISALLVASLVGDLLARAALRPVERYRRRASEIAAGDADLRLDVPERRDDEVTRLGHTLNEMLAALEESLDRERRFVNDASHELRTPLTLLKSRIQLARRRPRTAEEHERVLDELAVDVTRLASLAEQLLSLERQPGGEPGVCDATATVAGVVERRRLAQPDQASLLTVALPAAPTPVAVGPHALERIVTNLLDNAVTHGRPPMHLRLEAAAAYVVVSVADAGEGMPPELLAEATRRFTRSAEARGRPGAGLGLAIVEQLVTGAGGELRLCYAGVHRSVGTRADVACSHDDAMTITALLPAS